MVVKIQLYPITMSVRDDGGAAYPSLSRNLRSSTAHPCLGASKPSKFADQPLSHLRYQDQLTKDRIGSSYPMWQV